jgi:protoheme IX farnesyltransferase
VPSLLALATLVSYLFLYTPLKRISPLCTLIGRRPGRDSPAHRMGGDGSRLDYAAWQLFAILFLWQLPHFMAIAWMYRDDYERAGYFVLPSREGADSLRDAADPVAALGLILVTVPFGAPALLLDLAFLYFGVRFSVRCPLRPRAGSCSRRSSISLRCWRWEPSFLFSGDPSRQERCSDPRQRSRYKIGKS